MSAEITDAAAVEREVDRIVNEARANGVPETEISDVLFEYANDAAARSWPGA